MILSASIPVCAKNLHEKNKTDKIDAFKPSRNTAYLANAKRWLKSKIH
jgi:hypothetical protein